MPGATSIRQAFESVVGASHVLYSLNGTSSTGAGVGVAVIGETPYAEGKGDRTDLTVTSAQVATVRNLKQAGFKTVLVVVAGRPLILDPLLQYADAIVMAWLPGSEGAGVTDVLFGDVTRSASCRTLGHAAWHRSRSTWATPRTIRCIRMDTGSVIDRRGRRLGHCRDSIEDSTPSVSLLPT